MINKVTSQNLLLEPQDNDRLANLCGLLDENLRQIESYMDVEISNRGNAFIIRGDNKKDFKTYPKNIKKDLKILNQTKTFYR